jgi:hypothetical protein
MWKVFFIIPQNMVKTYLLEQNISAKSFYSELLEKYVTIHGVTKTTKTTE